MRNALKIIAFLFITALCCNIADVKLQSSLHTVPVKTSQESFLSVIPLNDGSQAIEARNLTSFFSTFSNLISKNKKEIPSAVIASALPKVNYFTSYIFYASYLIVRIETTDLIFPFHFFW